jgi:hypothetical protein
MARFIDDKTGRFGGWAEQRTEKLRRVESLRSVFLINKNR